MRPIIQEDMILLKTHTSVKSFVLAKPLILL